MTDDALLGEIQGRLDATGLYVSPTMSVYVDATEVTRIEAAIERSPEPLFVVLYPFEYDDRFGGDPGDLLSRLHDKSGVPGLYVANAPVYAGQDFRLEARAWDTGTGGLSTDTYALSAIGEAAGADDLGAQLVAVAEAVADGTVRQQYDELLAEDSETGTGTGSAGGLGDGGATPYLVGGGVVLALALVWALARRSRRTAPSAREFVLPTSVLDRVRDAHDEELTRRAHQDVLALGERIEAAEMAADAAPRSWQAALDHYDAARRVLGDDDRADVLDVVGAIVLAERGTAALAAARAGKRFTPAVPCFLNPLHGTGTTSGRVEHDGSRVTVPLCGDCRADLRKGRRPDILDVVRDGQPVHYFDTDHEPWASSGYGALHADLVERLHRRR